MRLLWVEDLYLLWAVSIHASVKDATGCCSSCWFNYLCFNPRICKRCDIYTIFLSKQINSFNPRICKRCDFFQNGRSLDTFVSIHASVKDATQFFLSFKAPVVVSIHASVKDATALLTPCFIENQFQSTHL